MPAFALPARARAVEGLDGPSGLALEDARESLAYWEARARRLPRHAVRRRREAREMAGRWALRVADAERAAYGRGLLGALVLLAAERRLPEATRRRARLVARRTVRAAAVLTLVLVTLAAAAAVAALELVAALLHGL
jgi:hypothetical protein